MRFVVSRLGFYLVAFWASVTLNFMLPRFCLLYTSPSPRDS